MRSFAPILRVARPIPSFTAATRRPFSICAQRLAGKEDAVHHEGRAEEAEHHKQDQLRKQQEGKGHWKPELASNSEEAISAEKEHGHKPASKEHIEELQKQSREQVHEKHGQK